MTLWRHWMVGQLDATLVAAMLLAIAMMLRHRLSPHVRSALLMIALIRLVLPPWIRSPWSEALVDAALIDDARAMIAVGLQADVTVDVARLVSLVTVLLLIRIAWTFVTAERRWLSATTATSTTIANGVEVRVSPDGEGPLAVGFRRKLIVLPPPVLELDRQALDAILAHEAAHHERRDLWWIAIGEVLRAIVWFNPIGHLIARELVAAREDGSDDWAVSRTTNDPFTYAQALLQSARMVAEPQPFGVAGAHPMGKRLQRLLDSTAAREGRLGVAGAIAIVVAAAAAIPGAHMPSIDSTGADPRIVVVIER